MGAVLKPFLQWSCVAIIQAWGHIAVSLALTRKNSTDEFAAFLHTSQYLRFYKNVLKIGTLEPEPHQPKEVMLGQEKPQLP